MVYSIIRLTQVQLETGLSKSTIYLRIKEGLFPPPIPLGRRARGWPISEVTTINKARAAQASEPQIKALVLKLIEERNSGSFQEAA